MVQAEEGSAGGRVAALRAAGRLALLSMAWLAVAAAAAGADGPSAASPALSRPTLPSVSLSVSLEDAGNGHVRFGVRNDADAAVSLLMRDTPLDRFVAHDAFEVLAPARGWPGVRRLAWTGPVARRLPPGPDEVLALGPGESASARVPVAELYAVPEGGRYTVRWAGTLRVATGDGLAAARTRLDTDIGDGDGDGFAPTRLASAAVELALAASPPAPRLRPAGYAGCSVEQRGIIDEAAGIAERWSIGSRAALEALDVAERPLSPRYRLWFGEPGAARFERVLDAFRALERALSEERIDYACGCTEPGVFAYVNPGSPYRITLCPVFWQTTADGRDSRAGTLVHELTHFRTVASTLDHAYGQGPSQRLAAARPDLAIANADSYGYFAENLPAVPVRPDGTLPGDDPSGGAAATFAPLEPGRAIEGRLARGERARFRVDGAASITLESLSGDADLFVYADPGRSVESCTSERVEPIDACAATPGTTAWIEVLGYSAAHFRLVAEPAEREGGEGVPLLGELGVGDRVSGRVGRTEVVAWRLVDGGHVELRSEAGDADLYVHAVPSGGRPLSETTLECRSFGDSAQGDVVERCPVAAGAPRYLLVAGFTDARYTLSVGPIGPDATRPAEGEGGALDDDPAPAVDDGTGAVAATVTGASADDGSAGGGASGGGAVGAPWLLLPAALALRRRRAQSRAIATA